MECSCWLLAIGEERRIFRLPMRFFERSTPLPVPAGTAYDWHTRPGAFQRLTPPWESVRVLEASGGIENGSRVLLRTTVGPFPVRWIAIHRDNIPGLQFADELVAGPLPHWIHTHRMEPDGPSACRMVDRIEYALPLGRLGEKVAGPSVRRRLERLFAYRHATLRADLAAHSRYAGHPRLHIAVTGASGLIGSSLIPFLTTGGHRVSRLVRGTPKEGEIRWDPTGGGVDLSGPAPDAVVHLAGENIAGGPWTVRRKRRILESRTAGTRSLAESLARLENPPKVLVAASAMGYYGNREDESVSERSPAGTGFLAEVATAWEAATAAAHQAGIRVVNLRIGIVLSAAGGLLGKTLLPFKLGLGGRIGSGRQWMSWISIDDVLGAICHALFTDTLVGPVNAVAPNPVTNAGFTRALGRVLHRPTPFPIPGTILRLSLGQMAEELLLGGQRVVPTRLQETRYGFRHPELEGALRHVLGR
jgi:uncharacterized protein